MWFEIFSVFLCIYLWFQYKFLFWKRLGYAYVPGIFPLGSGPGIGWREHSSVFLKREYEKLKNKGPAFGVYLLATPIIVPSDPELLKDIFVRNFDKFQDRGFTPGEDADPLNQNLLFKNGEEWKSLRAKLSPTFTSGRIKIMFPIALQKGDRLVKFIESITDQPVDVKEIYSSFSTEIIADAAFGIETECLGDPDNDFRNMADMFFRPTFFENLKLFVVIASDSLAKFLGFGYANAKVTNFFMKVVKNTLDYREQNNIERKDFFQLLLNIKKTQGMSFNHFAANSFVFFAAGIETSSSVMMFSSYELALNQPIQDRLRSEINEVLAKYNGEITYDSIREMKYLDMVFKESLRKYPVVDLQNRKSVEEFTIPNTDLLIPAKTTIMIPVYCIHNDERYWENPSKFNPERFTPENVQKRHPFVYFPFSEGPRQCIGKRFGTMQTKIGLVKILMNFRILTCDKTPIPIRYVPNATFQCPVDGMWLKFEKLAR